MKSRLWLELAWVPWQKTLDVKIVLDATKLFLRAWAGQQQTNIKGLYHCFSVCWSFSELVCELWYMNNILWWMILTHLIISARVSDLWVMAGMWHAFKLAVAGYTLPQHSICRYDGVLVTPHGCLMRILFIEWQEVALCIPKAVPKPLPSRRASVCRET